MTTGITGTPAVTPPLLAFDGVTFKYPAANAPFILKDSNASFERGIFYSIIGASGSGKTTALSLAGGLDSPTKGRILFEGRDIKEIGYTGYRRNHVAMVFQSYNLIPYMNALENVMLTMEISGTHKSGRRERAQSLLTDVGLDESDITRPVTRLSGGQQQRVAVARTLAGEAPIILADEPTGNLDSDTAAEIIEIFKKLAREKGKCVIVVSHSGRVAKASDVVMRFKNKTMEPMVLEKGKKSEAAGGDDDGDGDGDII